MCKSVRSLSKVRVIAAFLAIILLAPGISFAQEDETTPPVEEAEAGPDIQEQFNTWFNENINYYLDKVLFFPVYSVDVPEASDEPITLPLIVIVLLVGGVFFTFRYGFINIRLFKHSIQVIRGKFDHPHHEGEVSHFQALTSALSATVGLGNIAGVAVAISVGGPGAVFWMWLTAFFGMSMKFSSCTLAQLYRRVDPETGQVLGGPMVYLEEGLKEKGLGGLGKIFAVVFAVLIVLAAFGAGNMFQANQTASIITMLVFDGDESLGIQLGLGLLLSFLAGIVLIGGIKRIGELTSKLVPVMCIFYCFVCISIILMNLGEVPSLLSSIFSSAFNADAVYGGFVGVLVQGMRRAAFSNEAGLGSAAIAHAAAKTDEPVREGVVAMIGPFIDTLVICTMTALTILITNSHVAGREQDLEGVQITALAFSQLGSFVPYILCLAVFIFAYSTMVSWGYYGERCIDYLFGKGAITPYRFTYVFVIIIAPLLSLGAVLDFADYLLLSLAFPNIIGMAIISGKVKTLADDYMKRLVTKEIKPYEEGA
jgi:AGCS family alanine or glycine:cation symporter